MSTFIEVLATTPTREEFIFTSDRVEILDQMFISAANTLDTIHFLMEEAVAATLEGDRETVPHYLYTAHSLVLHGGDTQDLPIPTHAVGSYPHQLTQGFGPRATHDAARGVAQDTERQALVAHLRRLAISIMFVTDSIDDLAPTDLEDALLRIGRQAITPPITTRPGAT